MGEQQQPRLCARAWLLERRSASRQRSSEKPISWSSAMCASSGGPGLPGGSMDCSAVWLRRVARPAKRSSSKYFIWNSGAEQIHQCLRIARRHDGRAASRGPPRCSARGDGRAASRRTGRVARIPLAVRAAGRGSVDCVRHPRPRSVSSGGQWRRCFLRRPCAGHHGQRRRTGR